MGEGFDLQGYLTRSVETIVRGAMRAALRNPKQSAFLAQFAAASRRASKIRAKEELRGQHVPAFLIASVTSSCNLHCAGCYCRCIHATVDGAPEDQLTGGEWASVFHQAEEMGLSFIILAGGEPLLRRDVIEAAGKRSGILFPIITNGTFLDGEYERLFDRCRNLIPVMSIEGGQEATDRRRGAGVYDLLNANMERFRGLGVLFGASVTVTRENLREVVSEAFLDHLVERGCRLVFLIEYVPAAEETRHLAPGEAERAFLQERVERLRERYPETIFLSFPGDEQFSGGCLAAGRGFFHINSHGGAEPCPFSPYSDSNVRDTSLRDALNSRLFRKLRESDFLLEEHIGGCVLFEKQREVEALLQDE